MVKDMNLEVVEGSVMAPSMGSEYKSGDQSSDSDVDVVISVSSRMNRKKARQLFIEDDDGDELLSKERTKDEAVLDEGSPSSDEETTQPKDVANNKTRKRRVIKDSDSSDEEEKQGDERPKPASPIMSVKNKLELMAYNRRKQKGDNSVDTHGDNVGKVVADESFLKNTDLFDAEESSTDVADDDDHDEGLTNIKKKVQASSKPKRLSSRPRRENVQALHSESQRLLRQSRLSLPRHEPPKLTLDEFLTRRKTNLKSLRPDDGSSCNGNKYSNYVELNNENMGTSDSNCMVIGKKRPSSADALPVELMALPIDTVSAATAPSTAAAVFDSGIELPDIDGAPHEKANEVRSAHGRCEETPKQPEDPQTRNRDCPWEFGTSESEDNSAGIRNENKPTSAVQNISSESNGVNKLHERLSLLNARFTACTPKLAGTPQEIISFNDDDDDDDHDDCQDMFKQSKEGIDHLIDRFVKHTTVNKTTKAADNRQVLLNIVQYDDENKQFTNKSITVLLNSVDNNNNKDLAPGQRLNFLKETLKSKLIEKREEARKRRIQLHDMDNEHGFSDGKEEDANEEEDIADQSDSSSEDAESDDESDTETVAIKSIRRAKSAFVDDEAEEDGGSEGDDDDDDDDDGDEECDVGNDDDGVEADDDKKSVAGSCHDKKSEAGSNDIGDDLDNTAKSPRIESLKRDTDNNDSPPLAYFSSLPRRDTVELFSSDPCEKDLGTPLSSSLLNNSIELMGSLIPAHQPDGGFRYNTESELTPSQREDSQRLTQGFGFSQFAIPESQLSQSQRHLSVRRKLGLEVASQSQRENIEELFDLCSGQWSAPDSSKDFGVARLCAPVSQSTQENEAELLGLCSGKFTHDPIRFDATDSMTQDAFNLRSRNAMAVSEARYVTDGDANSDDDDADADGDADADDDDENNEAPEDSDDVRSVASDDSLDVGHAFQKKRVRVISDSESDTEEDNHEDDDDDDDASQSQAEGKDDAPANSPQRNGAKDFFEDEAELSGSEASSDEDEDLALEDDILEEELGDQDYISEDELHEQVEKVHHKLLMDEDQRQLRIYKELYLEDGELHTDGQARMRRFRWRNIDDSQNETKTLNSDADGGDEEVGGAGAGMGNDGIDATFRAQRHEREKWMSQNANCDDDLLFNDDSLFGRLAKRITVLHKQDSVSSETELSKSPGKRPIIKPRGSFLARRKDFLAKLAEQTKPVDNDSVTSNTAGLTNSRNFVFAAISPTKSDSKPTQLRRVASTPTSSLTTNKRPRIGKQASFNTDQHNHNSIFNLF